MKVIGHKNAEEVLYGSNLNASRSFLIEGPKGVGKALLALKFASHILGNKERVKNKSHSDFLLIEKRSDEEKGSKKEIVADEEVLPNESDMQTLATKIMAKRPQAVVLYLLPPQLATFAKAIKEQHFEGKFFGGIQTYNLPQVVASRGALVGTIFPVPDIRGNGDKFDRDFEQRFKEPLSSDQEVYGYDIGCLIIAGVRTGNINGYLQSLTEFNGLGGIYPRRENNFFEVPITLRKIASETSVEYLQK